MLVLRPDLLKDMEKIVQQAKKNLKASQDRQKSHVDLKRNHEEIKVGDHVYIKVKPNKNTLRL